jgi:UbiD family decarboxylase
MNERGGAAMGYYKDLREYIRVLENHGRLLTLKREINKDTELQPLVRWQLRGLPEKERKAFLFENVTDVKGRRYNGAVLVGAHAASRGIYALAMACKPEEIMGKWTAAQLHPIEPRFVSSGPCQEEIHMGALRNSRSPSPRQALIMPLTSPQQIGSPRTRIRARSI